MVPADSDRITRAPSYSGSTMEVTTFRLQAYHLLWEIFPDSSTILWLCNSVHSVLQPQSKDWFGLFPFRSPLLRKSIFLSFPLATKMFQFTRLSSIKLWIHFMITMHYHCWVASFGNPRIKAYLLLPEAYRCLSRPSSSSDAKASTMRSY